MESKEIIDYCEKNLPEVSIVESGEKQAFSIILKINSKEGYISLPSKKRMETMTRPPILTDLTFTVLT